MLEKYNKSHLNDSFFDNINGHSLDYSQRKVIIENNKNILVVAGAGSGKTLTIIGKIKYLIEKLNLRPSEILCLSFTNETVSNLLAKVGYKIDCLTFHKLAIKIMNEFGEPVRIDNTDLLPYVIDEFFESPLFYENCIDEINIVINDKYDVDFLTFKNKFKNEFDVFKRLFSSFICKIKCNNHNHNDIRKYFEKNKSFFKKKVIYNKAFMKIAIMIYDVYLEELNSYKLRDFDQLISSGIEIVKNYGMYRNYKYIIVDEFQDTSFIRFNLISEIMKCTDSKLMCVGDDYQSIYAFSGCNLDLFINFRKYFNNSKVMYINKTYRNSYELVKISTDFIKKNPYQLKKNVKANFLLKKPIKVIESNREEIKERFFKLLDQLIDDGEQNIMVLGRNNFDIYKYIKELDGKDCFCYRGIKIKYLTVHCSKGLEEDNVILINADDWLLGFPNKIEENKVMNLISKNKENYKYAEERRLFYVALTRTKKYIYILCNKNMESIFVKEIMSKVDIIK